MAIPWIETAFSGGEIAPSMLGRVDVARFHIAAGTLRNMFVKYTGGAYSRGGTRYVIRSKQNPKNGQIPPKLIPFSFSLTQDYVCEFGDYYVRFISQGQPVFEAPVTISAILQTDPCHVSAFANGYANGDWVEINNVLGMDELNGNTYIVANAAANSFDLHDLDGNPVDATAFNVYAGAGTASRIYTISSPYAGSDLNLLKFKQSADVLTITNPNFPPYNLSRFGLLNWTLAPVSIGVSIAAPSAVTASATVNPNGGSSPPTLPCAFAYEVTAVDPTTGEESQPSPVANVTDSVDIAATAGSIIVSWSAVAGADHYKVYRAPTSYNTNPSDPANAEPVPVGALFGLTALAFGTQFVDSNVTPDFSISPPQHRNPLLPGQVLGLPMNASSADWTTCTVGITTSTGSGAVLQAVIVGGAVVAVIVVNPGGGYALTDIATFTGDGTSASGTLNIGPQTGTYPSVVSYYQQRRVYANSYNQPDTYWMSQPGAFNNFDVSTPVGDADAITGTPWSEKVDGIQWMIEAPSGLVTFTGSGVQLVSAAGSFGSSPAITPSAQQAQPQSSVGSSVNLQPVQIDREILYWEPDNGTLRDLTYQLYFNIYTGVDASWQSSHLLAGGGHQIVDHFWCRRPNYLLWAARDDGLFLSYTFLKEQEIGAWAKHTTQGLVRRLCGALEFPITGAVLSASPQAPVDALYLCVERSLDSFSNTRYFIERMDDRVWQSAEDPWCVDCGVGSFLGYPNATLTASARAGDGVTFSAQGAFAPSSIGSTIRMGGGIAIVTAYVGSSQVIGNWAYPCFQTVPDDPLNSPIPQAAGNWSITPQINKLTGLGHLIGKQVVGLADGVPIGPLTVAADGTVALPFTASNVKVGLQFTAQVQSVYLDTGNPTIQGRRKAITDVTVRVDGSSPMQAGANQIDPSVSYPPPTAALWGTFDIGVLQGTPTTVKLPATYTSPGGQTVQPLFTGDIRVPIPASWQGRGQVGAQQTKPLPLGVLALIPDFLPGDTPENEYSPRSQPQRGRGQPERRA